MLRLLSSLLIVVAATMTTIHGSAANSRIRRTHRIFIVLYCFTPLHPGILAGASAAVTTNTIPEILVLFEENDSTPANSILASALRERLRDVTNNDAQTYYEFLEVSRFPESDHSDLVARYLAEKYSKHRPNIVIAIGSESLDFMIHYRDTIAPGATIIFCDAGLDYLTNITLPGDVFGVFTDFSATKTLEMARLLQPSTRHLVVMSGSSAYDQRILRVTEREIEGKENYYDVTYLTDLSIEEFVDHAAHLPADTILLVLSVFTDRNGRHFVGRDSLEKIARAASAPTYGPFATYIGHGIVGNDTVRFESVGAKLADLALDAINGKPVANVVVPQTPMADARQLERWNLSESALPAGTIVSFKEPGLWEQYSTEIVGVLAFVLLQSLVIAGLLFERRRRRSAESQARERLLELVHLNQSATAGALSASIAHELNQPLGAIQMNAATAETILRKAAPNLDSVRQILADIRDDDQRAGDIVHKLRGLLKKRADIDVQEFNLNEVVQNAVHILHGEAARRSITIVANGAKGNLPVRADRVHLQQVILNLATNAIDSAAALAPRERGLVVVETTVRERSAVEVSVSDNGRGVPADCLDSIFEPFYTTKPNGMGLGLSISRTIIETYGGRIWAENRPEGGAVLRFVLPLAMALKAA